MTPTDRTTPRAALLALADDIIERRIQPEATDSRAYDTDWARVIRQAAEAYPDEEGTWLEPLTTTQTCLDTGQTLRCHALTAAVRISSDSRTSYTADDIINLTAKFAAYLKDDAR